MVVKKLFKNLVIPGLHKVSISFKSMSDGHKDLLYSVGGFSVGIMLVAVGIYGFIGKYVSAHSYEPYPISKKKVTNKDDAELNGPSEEQLSQWQIDNYKVPDNQPRSIKISSVGISGLIQSVGVTSTNSVGVPNNIYFAGWFDNSPLPGQKGLSVIDGHMRGTYKDAIFKRLGDVKNGEEIVIEFGDRSVKKFRVFASKKLPVDRSAQYLFNKNPDIASQLNIITCSGSFDKTSRTYSDRIVVSAKPII